MRNSRQHACRLFTSVMMACASATIGMPCTAAGLSTLMENLSGTAGKESVDIVLVDQSASIRADDYELYGKLFTRIVEDGGQCDRLKPGTRIVLAPIADRPVSQFRSVEHRVPKTGVTFDDQIALENMCPQLKKDFSSLLKPARTVSQTYILDSLFAVVQLVQGAKGGRVRIFIASDMLEESKTANFAKQRVDAALASRIIQKHKASGVLPNLTGAEVYVVGAGGKDAEDFVRIQNFWRAYLVAAGATLVEYGRLVPGNLK